MTNLQRVIKEFQKRFVEVAEGENEASYYVQCDAQDLEHFLVDALTRIQIQERKRVVNIAFDWIWGGWNLDLANKDRAKQHFLKCLRDKLELVEK